MKSIIKLKFIIGKNLPASLRRKVFKKLYDDIKYIPHPYAMIIRNDLVDILFKSFGKDSFMKEGITIKGFGDIEIGKCSSINQGCFLNAKGGISIGDHVRIAHDCAFHTNSHNYSDPTIPIMEQGSSYRKITIKDDVWIGCNTTILQGVTVGVGSVIGANSVINRDIPPYSIAVGSPAKVVGNRDQLE